MRALSLVIFTAITLSTAAASSPELLICQGLDQLTIRDARELRDGSITRADADINIELYQHFSCGQVLSENINLTSEKENKCQELLKHFEKVGQQRDRAIIEGDSVKSDKLFQEQGLITEKYLVLNCFDQGK